EETDEREPDWTSGRGTEGVDPRRTCSQRGAFRPEYATDVRDAPGGGGIAGHRGLEGDMGGDNRRRCACGDRNPPSRRARDRHLCGRWPRHPGPITAAARIPERTQKPVWRTAEEGPRRGL